jgi:hypothetical protein
MRPYRPYAAHADVPQDSDIETVIGDSIHTYIPDSPSQRNGLLCLIH